MYVCIYDAYGHRDGESWSKETHTSRAETCTSNTLTCRVPPLPPGLQGIVNLSASPNINTHLPCVPITFVFSEPLAVSVSVGRAAVTGGINVTVTGQGFGEARNDVFCR